ncbi:hypothetical protein SLUN_01080 [Streptomyces lunaelactis]|uniref:Sel1 repeat family protein n=1 Tax=Streptomyces lunaelactis TaxID=1535768 RepID=A0A2R4SW25_9ACTN|nr:hypothetical protein SLUN_01080 [Streptomyces lunaelactis]
MAPGRLHELKSLLYELYSMAGAPTLDEIAEDIANDDALDGAPSRDTIRRVLTSAELPAHRDDAVAVAVVLARRAQASEDDATARVCSLWVQARLHPVEALGLPVRELDPFALEVHRPIASSTTRKLPVNGLPELTAYVRRAHDQQLGDLVEQAVGGRSVLAVLVGGSSTGKTRACWEAVQAVPDHWRLWHPYDPSRPEAALEALERVGPHTVVWLNETQNYLLTPAATQGERLAAGLRTLLNDPERAPVLVLGTIWPEYWTTLTTSPPAGLAGQRPHTAARDLLSGKGIAVPETFTGQDLDPLWEAAALDQRLAFAADRAEQGHVTQYLAGAPALIERYRTAPAPARALIEAAMDTRRLGHRPALPLDLLEAAAEGYLTDPQWDLLPDNWVEEALAYATQPLRGALGPLRLIRPRQGQTAFAQPHYRLADYLEQHARASRHVSRVPAHLWQALIDHAAPSEHISFAYAARDRGLLCTAVRFYTTAAHEGNPSALRAAADLLRGGSRTDEALAWYQRAADAGNTITLRAAAEMLGEAGRTDEALAWYERDAHEGNPSALRAAAEMLGKAGRTDEALAWYERDADKAFPFGAAEMLRDAGRTDEALAWYQRAADTLANTDLSGESLRHAAEMLRDAGRTDEALAWYQRAADAGDSDAPRAVAEMLREAGKADEALAWYQRAAGTGDSMALWVAAETLREAGQTSEAILEYQRAADAGNTMAFWVVAELLREAGRTDEVLVWLHDRVGGSNSIALRVAAETLRQADRTDEALTWLHERADAGYTAALLIAAETLRQADRIDEALTWLNEQADAGNSTALLIAAETLRQADRTDEALTWYQRAASAGNLMASRHAAQMLRETGRIDEAMIWYQRIAHVGTSIDLREVAEMLQEAGRIDEALTWLNEQADAGYTAALLIAAETLRQADRSDEAQALQRYGWAPDGSIESPWEAPVPD